ncbi:MAG: cytochrome c3 family protein [Desulfobulbaceae bacterium]
MRVSPLFAVVGWALFCLTGQAAAAGQDTCFACHDKAQFQDQVVHEPVRAGDCSVCHNPHVARYKGLLRYEKGKLCFTCHKEKAESFRKGIVHEPINRNECTACHEPHASPDRGLVPKNLKSRCLVCHGPRQEKDKIIPGLEEKYKYTHQPYLNGECGACHQPHNADQPMLLSMAPDELCGSCHEAGKLQAGHTGYPGTLRGCLTCHNPHGSDRIALIRNVLHQPYEKGCDSCHQQSSGRVSVEKCRECHAEAFDRMLATHTHLTRRDGNACVNCHSPHAGDEKRLLRAREKQVCAACHRPSIDRFKNSTFKHGGSIDKCVDCHYPHGGNDMAMLKGNGLEVCARCHENQGKFTHPVGPKVPDPRTGRMITCITCHRPMGTEYRFNLILDGKQQLCVQCHKEY